MKLAIAQINFVVGDLSGNIRKILDYVDRARNAGAALIVFPELALVRLSAGRPVIARAGSVTHARMRFRSWPEKQAMLHYWLVIPTLAGTSSTMQLRYYAKGKFLQLISNNCFPMTAFSTNSVISLPVRMPVYLNWKA